MCWFTARAWVTAGLAGSDPLAQHRFRRRNVALRLFRALGRGHRPVTVQRWRSRAFPQLRRPYPSRRPPHATRQSQTGRRQSQTGRRRSQASQRTSRASRSRVRSRGPVWGTRGPDSPPKPPGVHTGPLSLACFHSTTREGCQAMVEMQIAVGLAVKITIWSSPQTTPGTTLR